MPVKENVFLPNNRSQAVARLKQQKRTLLRNPELKTFYEDAIQQLIDTDILEIVDEGADADKSRVFNIPHFVIQQSKRRLIYDASAKFERYLLNSVLYQGMDNLEKLVDVVMRFRRNAVAFCADIKEMFLHCGINDNGRDLLRILWFKDHDYFRRIYSDL